MVRLAEHLHSTCTTYNILLTFRDTQTCCYHNKVFKLIAGDRGAPRNPNLQVVITHASQVCNQHLFRLQLRMNGCAKKAISSCLLTFYTS